MSFSLTPRQLVQAKEAIEMLSSLSSERPSTSATIVPSQLSNTHSQNHDAPISTRESASGSAREVLSAANQCLRSFSHFKASDAGRRRKIKSEVSTLFGKKKKAMKCVWKHKFVCLADRNQQRIPTTDTEKDELLMAGLGEKEIAFTDMELTAVEFRDLLYFRYPSLQEGGGFQFFKCMPNSRLLVSLSKTTLSSPAMLKARVGNSRTYIRPIQKNLDLTPTVELPGGAMEQCFKCGQSFNAEQLPSHLDTCDADARHSIEDEGNFADSVIIDLTETCNVSDNDDCSLPPSFVCDFNDGYNSDEFQSIEKEIIEATIGESLQSSTGHQSRSQNENSECPLFAKLKSLREINIDNSTTLNIEVRRNFVLSDAMTEARKKKFDPRKFIKVTFVGEGAIDHGGPKREFFRIFAEQASNSYFRGDDGQPKFFKNDILAVQNNDFHILGVFTVLSILHGGNGLPFLAKPVFDYLTTGCYSAMIVPDTEIPEIPLRFLIKKLKSAESDSDIQEAFGTDEAMDTLYSTGYAKATTHLGLTDRTNLLNVLLGYHLMAKVKSEMDQFLSGLSTFNLLDHIRQNPILWKPYFAPPSQQLTAESIKELFWVQYSEQGSRFRPMDEQTYIFFRDFLDDCEDNDEMDCSVKDVLVFFSGSDSIPPCGFEGVTPTMVFLHGCNDHLPTASTCDLEFRLPAMYGDYKKFKNAMILGLKGHDGFGGV